MPYYGLFGKICATRGQGNKLAEHLLEAAAALEEAPGCFLYLVSRDPDDGDAIWVSEVWQSAEAHQASLGLVDVQELIGRARPLIAGMGERFEHRPIGGKGLTPSG